MSEADSPWRGSSNWRNRDAPAPGRDNFRSTRDRDGPAPSPWRRGDGSNGGGAPLTAGSNNGRSRHEPSSFQRGTRPYDRERKSPAQRDDDGAAKAIAEGRRIYVGNLRYQAKPEDIEGLLENNGLGHYEKIHISIDPFTGRNPSYCFVEFPDRDSAGKAMATLEGQELLGREVKCRPCQPKGGRSGGRQFSEGINRWGNWSGEERREEGQEEGQGGTGQSRRSSSPGGAPESFSRYRQDFTGLRLCVTGLPRMTDQAANFEEISGLFKGFELEGISKRVSATEQWRSVPGNHDYCFVDFPTPDRAQEALKAVNGTWFRGARLKVSFAKGRSQKWRERDDIEGEV